MGVGRTCWHERWARACRQRSTTALDARDEASGAGHTDTWTTEEERCQCLGIMSVVGRGGVGA